LWIVQEDEPAQPLLDQGEGVEIRRVGLFQHGWGFTGGRRKATVRRESA
jgi:hypothetical protein